VIELAGQEVQDIRRLLTATPENCDLVHQKLERVASFLRSQLTDMARGKADAGLRDRVVQLAGEMSRVRILFETAAQFFSNLDTIRAAHFGAYDRNGALKTLASSSRTVIHL
jgi:hypothetical protein